MSHRKRCPASNYRRVIYVMSTPFTTHNIILLVYVDRNQVNEARHFSATLKGTLSIPIVFMLLTIATNMFHFENMPGGHRAWRKRKGKKYLCCHRQSVTSLPPILGPSYQRTEEGKVCVNYAALSALREHWRGTEIESVKRNLFSDCSAENDWYRSRDTNCFRFTEKLLGSG